MRGDGGRFTTPPPSRLEARSRLSKHSCSFDHLIGASEESRRDLEAEGLRGLEVNDQVEPGRLLDRKISWPRALQDLVDVSCRAMAALERVRSIGHQAADLHEGTDLVHRREAMLDRKFRDPLTKRIKGGGLLHNDRACVSAQDRGESLLDFVEVDLEQLNLQVQRFGGLRALPKQQRSGGMRP